MSEKNSNQFQESSFIEWKVGKLLKHFAIPCILSLLVSALYNIVDQIFVGQGVGYLGNAATNVVYPLTVIGLGFSLLLGDGCAAFLSISLGKGDKQSGAKAIGNTIIGLVVISLVIMILGYSLQDQILNLFGATDSCIDYARTYYQIILGGMAFYIISSAINSIIRADGSPQYSMLSMVLGAVINIILDPIVIFALDLGVAGAAYATIIGQFASFVFSVFYLFRAKSFKLDSSSFKVSFKTILKVMALGVSSFITQISIVITCVVTNNIMIKYGALSEYGSDIPLAVMGIVMKVFSIVVAIVVGISAGGQPVIGYNYGAKQYSRVLKVFKLILLSCGIVGLIATIIFEAIPQYVILIFGNGGEEYTKFAILCFRIYLGTIFITCLQKASCIFLQSLGKPYKAIFLSLIRDTISLIPAVLILPIYLGIEGALYSAPIADAIAGIVTFVLVSFEYRNISKLDKESNKAIQSYKQ